MNTTDASLLSMNETNTVQSPSDHNKTLVIILTVALPILLCLGLLIFLLICYRRRLAKLWVTKLENSSRLQSFDFDLTLNSAQPPYYQKKQRFSRRQFLQPHTETIVFNQLSSPSTPVVNNLFQSPAKGETNVAFDEYSIKNEQKPILKQHPSTLERTFPASLQTPVQTITSAFVKAIATHRYALLTNATNTSLETLIPPANSFHNSQHSVASLSCPNTPPTVLLFSQRTQF